jgi:hypothetical protein
MTVGVENSGWKGVPLDLEKVESVRRIRDV